MFNIRNYKLKMFDFDIPKNVYILENGARERVLETLKCCFA